MSELTAPSPRGPFSAYHRNQALISDFNGSETELPMEIPELAKRYEIGIATVQRILELDSRGFLHS